MSAKPSVIANWAASGAIATPSGAKQALGFVVGEAPPAQTFNWLHNTAAAWQQYLSDGNLTGAHTFSSTVGITGLLTLSGGLSIVGGINQTGGGSTSLSGTLNVTGATSLSGALTQTGGGATALSGTLGVTGLITATAGVTAGVNQSIVISGTGKFKHPTITDTQSPFGAFAGNVNSPVVTMSASGEILQLNGSAIGAFCVIPLKLRVGWNVSAIRARVFDSVTGPTKAAVQVASIQDGTSTLVMTGGLSAGNASWQSITASSTAQTFTVVAGKAYHVRVALSGGTAALGVNHIEIDYDQP